MLGPALTAIPSVSTDRLVEGWWAATSTGSGDVVPDGAVDLIWTPGLTPFVAGPDRQPRPTGLAVGRRVVGVRLRPGVAASVLGDAVDRATGRAVSLDQVWSRSDIERLAHALGHADGDLERAQALARAVGRRVPADWRPDAIVTHAVEHIRSAAPDHLAALDTGGLGDRQFRRRFSAAMGYGPTFYGRLIRLERFAGLVGRHPDRSLAQLAAQTGFSDQAHLARDVRQLLGTTPSRLRATA